MGREARKVPHDWQHPQRDGRYEPLFDGYEVNAKQWLTEFKAWLRDGEQGEHFWIDNPPPNPEQYMLVGVPEEARTHLMLYETTTEGTPCGPAFATMDELCAWAEKNATTFFQSGPDGKPVVNPITGQYVFTPRGQAAMTYGTQYRQQFAARYGSQPHPADVIEHVQKSLAYDEARGVFGPPMPQQPQMPGVPQFQAAAQYPAVAPAPQMYGQPPMQYPMVAPVAQPWAPQPYGVPAYGAQPQFSTPQDDMVRRAIAAQQAGYQPQPNGTIQTAMQNALAPQNPSLDFKSMLRQSAQARGISTEHFSS